MTHSSRFVPSLPLLGGLLLAAACDATPTSQLMGPSAPSFATAAAPAPAVTAGPAIGASRIYSTNILKGDHIVLLDDPFGVLVGNAYAFDAKAGQTGLATGTFDFTAVYQKVKVHLQGTVVCFTVSGNKARVGGIVTKSNFAAIPVGTSETWSLTDNGAPANHAFDTGSSFLGGDSSYALAYCANGLPYAEQPIIGGAIQITH